ncbi:lipoprotein-anchoring transpeptidase ErfK/SrfK [Rhodoblastus acidophilus]|uniref:L,D-transpeptidase n=1 Tax=Rhodoblastus acidophilus TaxID=1074 RepID=UPI002224F0D9|nr:L,D-transpeptidase [Rhodoblastus acidophilus]MCW2284588.1 lipoprotein-anchoring transpeptidase ErfK/SrfK [Rhodoblastus acidophilus]MCW2333541.1 lipoprotein-anchoring transpeptidase ErfK/SrfK [Rhodoblastus acidophilus]
MRMSVVPPHSLLFSAFVALAVLVPALAHARPTEQEMLEQVGTGGGKIVVNIDKSTQKMTVTVEGGPTYTWPVSTGMRGYSTPSGNYTATSMNEIWYSKEFDNAPMPHAVFFMRDGHAIHATYEVKHLGKPASHGCVRLSPQNATTLFELVKKSGLNNTQVIVSGTSPGGDYLAGRKQEPQVIQPAREASRQPVRQVVRQPAPQVQEPFFPRIFGFQ